MLLTLAGGIPTWLSHASFEPDRFMRGDRAKNGSGASHIRDVQLKLHSSGPRGFALGVRLFCVPALCCEYGPVLA